MEKEMKQRWIDALRSGKYKQGESMLRRFEGDDGDTEASYCCLGVLCELENPDSDVIEEYQDEGIELIPEDALDGYGLTDTQQNRLAALNDGGTVEGMKLQKCNFGDIADYIERYL